MCTEEAVVTFDSISVRFMTAVAKVSPRSSSMRFELTILHLPNPGLEVVKSQVADLGLETVEIHGGSRLYTVRATKAVQQNGMLSSR